jgi:hypothetical protein
VFTESNAMLSNTAFNVLTMVCFIADDNLNTGWLHFFTVVLKSGWLHFFVR